MGADEGTLSNHLYVPTDRRASKLSFMVVCQYTYFGLFPSIMGMPILLRSRPVFQVTGLPILSAWCVRALFGALMLWPAPHSHAGEAVAQRTEAAAAGSSRLTG